MELCFTHACSPLVTWTIKHKHLRLANSITLNPYNSKARKPVLGSGSWLHLSTFQSWPLNERRALQLWIPCQHLALYFYFHSCSNITRSSAISWIIHLDYIYQELSFISCIIINIAVVNLIKINTSINLHISFAWNTSYRFSQVMVTSN